MNDIDKPNASQGPKPAAEQEKWLSKDGIEAVPKSTQAPNPADTAQEAVHEVMPKIDVPKPKPLHR
uniref:Transcription factor n=1 Tax=uncultured bacterium 50 TaxID=1748278 RepID=A0A0U3TS64_9BACT|nr:transcription factor [uncultured bacterium 50]